MAKPLPWLKPGLMAGGLAPGALIVIRSLSGTLAADQVSEALNRFGLLALIFLVATLLASPLKNFLGWSWPMRIRRMLGLFAFGYALAHVLTYALIDQVAKASAIVEDIVERPFILVGFLAFVLLVPLAVTSTDRMVRRLGYIRWKLLHRLAYLATLLACLHFILRVKKDLTEPALYGSIVVGLLVLRLGALVVRLRRRAPPEEARSRSPRSGTNPGSG